MIQWTVYPQEVTRQLQARESSPVIDRRSNNCAAPPTTIYSTVCVSGLYNTFNGHGQVHISDRPQPWNEIVGNTLTHCWMIEVVV